MTMTSKLIASLGNPTTNTETYLAYLTGSKNITLADLPKPYTNVDTYLYHLCINGGIGGGGNITADTVPINPITGVVGDNVQLALESLANDISLIEHSDVYIFENYAEYQTSLPSLELKTGDLLHFLDSTDVIDYEDKDVNNGGKPVTMIFDETRPNNNLRLFARLTEQIDLTEYAKKNAYNLFTAKNLFTDLHIGGAGLRLNQSKNGNRITGQGNQIIFGRRLCSSHYNGRDGIVDCLRIGINQNKTVGDLITTTIWAVEKGATKADDIPKKIADKIQLPVKDGDPMWYGDIPNFIEFSIKRKFDKDTYFLYTVEDTNDIYFMENPNTATADFVYITGTEVTQENIANSNKLDTVGEHQLVLGDVDIVDFVKNEIDYAIENANITVDLDSVVKTWGDLESVTEYPHANLLNVNLARIPDKYYDENGGTVTNNDWDIVHMPVKEGATYTMFRKTIINRIVYFTSDGTFVSSIGDADGISLHNYYRKVFTIPTGQNIQFIGMYFQPSEMDSVMILEGDLRNENLSYIPYLNNGKIIIGKDIVHEFNNTGTPLTSTDMENAIKESINLTNTNLQSYAHKEEENVINSKTTLMDGYIPSNNPSLVMNPNYSNNDKMGENGYSAIQSFKASANQFVKRLVVGIHDSIAIGSTINNITVSVVNINNLPTTQTSVTITEHALHGWSAVVQENTIIDTASNKRVYPIDCDRVVILPINKSWAFEAMFVLTVPGMIWNGRLNSGFRNGLAGGGNVRLNVGQSFTLHAGNNSFIGRVVMYTSSDDVRLSSLIVDISYDSANTTLTFVRADGTGKRINFLDGSTTPLQP